MKPHFHKVPIQMRSSFSVRHDVQPNFGNVWHYHPELELHYVVKGEGTRLVGDHVGSFHAGELLLLGENLPHTWHCQEDYFEKYAENYVEAIVVHFSSSCLGHEFLNLPETNALMRLFEKAKRGMQIFGTSREQLKQLMMQAVMAEDLRKVILLLEILEILTKTQEYRNISTMFPFLKATEGDMVRMNSIYNYTLNNFTKDISLKEIASVSNLTMTSFCRYFKIMTKKTYADFLNEVRINHACKLLSENTLQIDEICYTCGFNNLSNFYRQFKRVTRYTPKDFRRRYNIYLS
ncbi:AraC family transcriptional regulator [Olivibacter domesticus]|uniref:AraC-type DNA-binding protein n=1 Tax=Olivibacter domesticus TaxID=407022 RepID=A0A1H7GJB8_OLID1|nr:AraC family transcriptional regulator [Olivibacter domesticus]SEK38208.1 AraC-type DNA-binding protein [Olivibacter domesticus]